MSHMIYKLFFLTLVLFELTLIGYSQSIVEQSDTEPDFFGSLLWILLISLVALVVLAAIVYFIYQVVQQWRTIHKNSLNLLRILQSVQQVSNDTASRLKKIETTQFSVLSQQEKIESDLEKTNDRINNINSALGDLKTNIETDDEEEQTLIDYQQEAEREIQEAQEQVENLANAYKDGKPIDMVNIENPTPSQNALLILNWIARDIEEWESDLEHSGTSNTDLIQTLRYANQAIKDKLKEIRGLEPPLLIPLDMETDVSTDVEYNEIQNKCNAYISRFKGILLGYQLGCTIDEAEYNQFIPQFIKDRLFNGVARFVQADQLPEQLNQFLQFVGYEIVPIEIGKTKADARVHDIQGSKQTGTEPGTIVEIILPGLQRSVDGEIVQKPVVIRGE